MAAYFDRGWCFTESSWASLTKSGRLSLDLGLMRDDEEYSCVSLVDECTKGGGRRPPLLPSRFAAELETKSFTNGKDDKPLVTRLYAAAFEEQFGKATGLRYVRLGWGDAEAAQVAEVLASGAAPDLRELYLGYNQIGVDGCKALAAALGKEGAAPRLEELWLGRNKIGDEGCTALAAALKEGAAPSLKARDATPRHTPLPRPMLITATPLACRSSRWAGRTGSSLSWWPCARSAASSWSEPLQPRPGRGARGDRRASTAESDRPRGCGARRAALQRRWGLGGGARAGI